MKHAFISAAFAATVFSGTATAVADEGEFIGYMSRLQYFTHKLGLAIDAGNRDLQRFYAHEVEEQVEEALEVEKLGDIPVSGLIREFLVPKLEELESAIDGGNAEVIDAGYGAMIEGCNRCHSASQRDFLRIERRTDNPYAQSFDQ